MGPPGVVFRKSTALPEVGEDRQSEVCKAGMENPRKNAESNQLSAKVSFPQMVVPILLLKVNLGTLD